MSSHQGVAFIEGVLTSGGGLYRGVSSHQGWPLYHIRGGLYEGFNCNLLTSVSLSTIGIISGIQAPIAGLISHVRSIEVVHSSYRSTSLSVTTPPTNTGGGVASVITSSVGPGRVVAPGWTGGGVVADSI